MRQIPFFALSLVFLSLPGCSSETEPFEPTGNFASVAGEEGEVGFGESFVDPPNVELRSLTGASLRFTTVVEVKTTGFKWKNSGSKGDRVATEEIGWKANGKKKKK